MPSVKEKPDVFQFLEKDEKQDADAVELEGADTAYQARLEAVSASSSSSSSSRDHHYPVNYPRPANYQPYPDNYRHSWNAGPLPPGSFHSDSGISVRSNSPERDSQHLFQSKGKGRAGAMYTQSHAVQVTSPTVLEPFDQSPDMSPEAFYSVSTRPTFQHTDYDADFAHPPCHRDIDLSHELDGREELDASEDANTSTHDLRVNNFCSDGNAALKPIYRKFETLNNRILLYLQDEISKLESQLQQLDNAISTLGDSSSEDARSTEDGPSMSVGLEWQRKELVGRISSKLDQYSKSYSYKAWSNTKDHLDRTLSSYSSICRHLDPVSAAEIIPYKDWMEGHPSSGEAGLAFILHEQDLITVPEKFKASVLASERSAIATGSAMLMTIIAFKTIPDILSRLLVAMIISIAMSYSGSTSLTMDSKCFHEYGRRIAM